MKLKDLWKTCIQEGMNADPRGASLVNELLKREKTNYEKMSAEEKEDYDTALLENPYTDSRILNGTGEEDIRSMLVGIDIETPELLLASHLRTTGKKIDMVLTHHPEGKAYATFYQVMAMQADIINKYGVPITIAESMLESRMKDVSRRLMPANHTRAVDAAKLLGIPFMSAHTVADNHVTSFLQKMFDAKKPKYVGDVVKLLKEVPEYKYACQNALKPQAVVGSKDNRAGKVFVDMTGGTEGAKEALEKLADSGVGTVVGMHMSEEHLKVAEKSHIRVVIAGHISSDNLGVNLLLDKVEKKFGKLNVLECSGFYRYSRNSKKQ